LNRDRGTLSIFIATQIGRLSIPDTFNLENASSLEWKKSFETLIDLQNRLSTRRCDSCRLSMAMLERAPTPFPEVYAKA
jgi:hypothetical protein